MKNTSLAGKIKELRTQKGLSQEELAAHSQLSLRTIQRIEKSETEPHGDTLKRLSAALNITPEELTISKTIMPEKGLLMFYLPALSFVIFPLLGPLVPFILWLTNPGKVSGHETVLRRFIIIQLTWCGILFFAYIAFVLLKILHWPGAGYSLYAGLILYILNFVFIVIKAITLSRAK